MRDMKSHGSMLAQGSDSNYQHENNKIVIMFTRVVTSGLVCGVFFFMNGRSAFRGSVCIVVTKSKHGSRV